MLARVEILCSQFRREITTALAVILMVATIVYPYKAEATHSSTVTIDFEPPLPAGLIASTDRLLGDFVPAESRITNQYADLGILFENVALLYLEPHFGMPATNFINGYDGNFIIDHDAPYYFTFVSPVDETVPATTEFFSIDSDKLGGSGLSFTASAYDLDGNFLGSATAVDTTFPGPGSTVTLHGIGQMHTVVLQGAYSIGFDNLRFAPVSAIRRLNCGDIVGRFEPPMQMEQAVAVKKNRVFPYKALLRDDSGLVITDADLEADPIIQVLFTSSTIAETIDVTAETLSAGQGSDGNEFNYNDGVWQYNLMTKNYSAPGTYEVKIFSGNVFEYEIKPSCKSVFVIE